MSISRRKAINFIFPCGVERSPATRERLSSESVRSSFRAFPFILGKNPPVQGLPRSKRSNGVNSICWQSCTFWIRGKRPFKPLSKLPSLPSFSPLSFFPLPLELNRTSAPIQLCFTSARANFYSSPDWKERARLYKQLLK